MNTIYFFETEYKTLKLDKDNNNQFNTLFSGYRLGDPCEFTQLSVVCGDDKNPNWYSSKFGDAGVADRDIGAAVATGFGLTVAQAHNQGTENCEE